MPFPRPSTPQSWLLARLPRKDECQRALTQKRTLWGGGALQLLDLRLFEDGGERGGALGPDAVVRDTASEGQDENGERVGVSTGADTKGVRWRT